jgi:hypothetical protein
MMAEFKTMSIHKAVASWMWIFDFGSYVPWWAPTNIVTESFWHSWRYQIILEADLVKLFANPSTELSICSICNNRQQELAGTLGFWKWLGMICQELGGTTIIWIGALCFLRHTLDCGNLWKEHTQLQHAKVTVFTCLGCWSFCKEMWKCNWKCMFFKMSNHPSSFLFAMFRCSWGMATQFLLCHWNPSRKFLGSLLL